MSLNEYQQKAVDLKQGKYCVISSAGSGKSHSIIERTASLIKEGTVPERILILSFSKKTVTEMQERMIKRLGEELGSRVDIKTFHAMGYRMIASSGIKCDLIKPWEIENYFSKYENLNVANIMSAIGFVRNMGIKENDKINFEFENFSSLQVSKLFKEYTALKKNLNKIDFDDMIVLALELLKSNANIKRWYNENYDYVMGDEFQDINIVQNEMLKLITEKKGNLMVFMDAKQAIYGFRGSSSEYALEFDGEFIQLPINYRSKRNIVDMSNKFIDSYYNKYSHHQNAVSNDKSDGKIVINDFKLADEINNLIENGKQYKDICILYRNNAMSANYEFALNELNIPYTISGGRSFFDRFEIKTVISYLRLVVNKYDNESFNNVYNTPNRWLGKAFINQLMKYDSYYMNMDKVDKKHLNGVNELKNIIGRVRSDENCGEAIKKIVKMSNLIPFLQKKYAESDDGVDDRLDNLNSLVNNCSKYKTVKDFINFLDNASKQEPNQNSVQLMTIHKSKGLEFDTVFLLDINEGKLPSSRARDEREEANIFYVGMTRAKDNLYIDGNSQYVERLKELGF